MPKGELKPEKSQMLNLSAASRQYKRHIKAYFQGQSAELSAAPPADPDHSSPKSFSLSFFWPIPPVMIVLCTAAVP